MVLLFLHIILMLFFAILWTGSQNQFGGWYDVGRQAIQEDVAGGQIADKPEKWGMASTMTVEEPSLKISTISAGSQIPIVTHTPVSKSLSLKY
jgi:hypothetical protein